MKQARASEVISEFRSAKGKERQCQVKEEKAMSSSRGKGNVVNQTYRSVPMPQSPECDYYLPL